MNNTPTDIRCQILSDLWLDYKHEPELSDFVQYNDIGLPLAFAVTSDIVELTPTVSKFIDETFDLLLSVLNIEEDTGFQDLSEVWGEG
jgi:hypothetical protein